jgi:Cysteine dioxygenase type I
MPTFVPAPVRVGHLALARAWSDPDAWPLAPRFNAARRWFHRLHAAPDHEVWLLTWLPGQGTDLHDHGPSAGAFVIVSGELSEESFEDGRPGSRHLPTGAGREFSREHVHRIVNAGDRPAVSVHVYGPALSTMTRYQVVGRRITAVGIDRAGVQW